MTVPPSPARKTPWLAIVLGALAAFCLCAVVIGAAAYAFLAPTQVTTTIATEVPTEVVIPLETSEPTALPVEETQEPQEPTNSFAEGAAPVGTPADIGNNMSVTVLEVTRPADDIVANGSSFNTTVPEGEEFMQVTVQVTCRAEAGSQCTFYPTVMKAVLSDGSTRDLQTFIEGVDDWDTALDIPGGETQQGLLLFIVPQAETDPVLSYQDIYEDQPVYMQLP